MFFQSFLTALEMLRMHKLRAFLTMLGVIIGVMAVSIIVMVSNGFQFYITNQFAKLGSDTITIVYDRWGNSAERNAKITPCAASGATAMPPPGIALKGSAAFVRQASTAARSATVMPSVTGPASGSPARSSAP